MNKVTAQALPQSATIVARPALAALPTFGLTEVMARVAGEHVDWSAVRLQKAEDDYRLFLATVKTDRQAKHSPSKDVDEVWHAHILFTKQYHADCNAYFGHYLHHEPTDKSTTGARCQGGSCGADSCTACGAGTVEPSLN